MLTSFCAIFHWVRTPKTDSTSALEPGQQLVARVFNVDRGEGVSPTIFLLFLRGGEAVEAPRVCTLCPRQRPQSTSGLNYPIIAINTYLFTSRSSQSWESCWLPADARRETDVTFSVTCSCDYSHLSLFVCLFVLFVCFITVWRVSDSAIIIMYIYKYMLM